MRTQTAGALALLLFVPLLACGDARVAANAPRPVVAPTPVTSAPQPSPTPSMTPAEIPVYTYDVVNTYPHDPKAYTQGLVYYDDQLYESTGQYGSSSLRRVELKKGKVKKKIEIPKQYFAEGMTILDGKIYQLTWHERKGFVYDLKDFRLEKEFAYQGQGWGLTTDGHSLIMSNGSHELHFLDPATFQVQRTVSVFNDKMPLTHLNELEYIRGEIYANIWQSDRIVRLDPETGRILAWIDLTNLRPPETFDNTENVLNGIAYDSREDRLFVTGKRWPKIFEIRLKKK